MERLHIATAFQVLGDGLPVASAMFLDGPAELFVLRAVQAVEPNSNSPTPVCTALTSAEVHLARSPARCLGIVLVRLGGSKGCFPLGSVGSGGFKRDASNTARRAPCQVRGSNDCGLRGRSSQRSATGAERRECLPLAALCEARQIEPHSFPDDVVGRIFPPPRLEKAAWHAPRSMPGALRVNRGPVLEIARPCAVNGHEGRNGRKASGRATRKLQSSHLMAASSKAVRGSALESLEETSRALEGIAPRKGNYRVRAHVNPLASSTLPSAACPAAFRWDELFRAAGGDLSMPGPKTVAAIEWPQEDDEDDGDRTSPPDAATALDAAASRPAERATPTDGDKVLGVARTLKDLPALASPAPVDILDIGAGFGGLLFGLNKLFPRARKLALEIRGRVAEFVRLKIVAARARGEEGADRCAVLRVNAMRQLPSLFPLQSLSMMFICFPDPHFKRQNHRRRIVSPALLTEYASFLRPGGILFTITDVEALHVWMRDHIEEHPMFQVLPCDASDPCVRAMQTATDEARKSLREGREHYWVAARRVTEAEADAAALSAGPFFGGYYGGTAVPRTARGTNDAPEMFHWTVRERETRAKAAKAAKLASQ
jgi:tRNA (guanine-N7-)-methyltransferase